MTQLEHFKKTMKHEPTGKILFYAEFIDDLLERFVEYLKLNPEVGASSSIITDDKNYTNANAMDLIAKKFSMFYPKHVQLANIKHPTIEDFLPYFADYDIPERAFINGIGVLEVPSKDSGLHFTEYVSPLRYKTALKDM